MAKRDVQKTAVAWENVIALEPQLNLLNVVRNALKLGGSDEMEPVYTFPGMRLHNATR
jgi:hypothetical protein